ncbi:type 1 phosphatases regulator YPI1-like isoform X2 [Varroa jacobsoni]|uniref:type 1 phosphatases regulator YPI1-like isoform X2 n=1 Tax=Varroa jacobsoni TaxID=62625 RepID=UPI000BF75C19|nr:type 1 phosphatases regulator YPI1-like isoform X2 [Varroa jacobsoni]
MSTVQTTTTQSEQLSVAQTTVDGSGPSSSHNRLSPSLVLKLKKPKSDRKVGWSSDVIDNENLNKKKSKCCCVYTKPTDFGESSDEEEGDCEHCSGHVETKKSQKRGEAGNPSEPHASAGYENAMMEDDRMDAENRRLTDNLARDIRQLKSLAYDIEDEAKEHNRYLDGMVWNFGSTQNLLTGGVHRINKLLGSGRSNRRLMCYIVAAVIVFGLIFYHVVGRVTTVNPSLDAVDGHNNSN